MKETFAENLQRLFKGKTVAAVAKMLEIDRKRLHRWTAEGIERPTGKTSEDLEKIRAFCRLASVEELWQPFNLERSVENLTEKFAEVMCSNSEYRQAVAHAVSTNWLALKRSQMTELSQEEAEVEQAAKQVQQQVRAHLKQAGIAREDWPATRKAACLYVTHGEEALLEWLGKYKTFVV